MKLKKINLREIKIAPYLVGSIISIITALMLILAFALIIRYAGVPNSAITPVNIVIKIVSIAVGVFVATKNGEKGLKKGIIVGITFVILSFFVFAILSRSIEINIMLLADIFLGAIVGAITGIVFVNLRK